jgi:hypothetical protein
MIRFALIFVMSLAVSSQASAVKWNNSSKKEEVSNGSPFKFDQYKKEERFELGEDFGFGLWFQQSLGRNFQDWGATVTTEKVRLGKSALKFETREGFCGADKYKKGHSDCKSGRNRHEFSSSLQKKKRTVFKLNKEYWHSLSLYIPSEADFDRKIETGLFQFHGKPNVAWKFHFNDIRGLYVTSYTDMYKGKTFQKPEQFLDKWNDVIIQVIHSTDPKGILNVWINGEKVYEFKGITTLRKGKPYFKFGIYNTAKPVGNPEFNNGENFKNIWVYFDEIRFSETCEGLKLNNLGYNCKKL